MRASRVKVHVSLLGSIMMNLTRANVEGNGFDKDLDVMYDAAKRTGEEDRALEDN